MLSPLVWFYIAFGTLLFAALVYQGRLTARSRGLLARSPIMYSQLPLPEGVDLRAVLENPRLFYFSLASAGTVLRIVLGVTVFLAFDVAAPGSTPWLSGVASLVILVGAEIASRHRQRSADRPIGTGMARAMKLIATAVRLLPARGEPRGSAPGRQDGELVSTLDGQEMFEPTAKRFLTGFLDLKRLTVRQVMVPRQNMVTVREDWSISRAARVGTDRPFARIPVADKDGEIVGLVHMKDLLLLLHSNQAGAFVKGITREVTYVPGTQRLDSLLREFQTRRVHVAVVQDEYGRTAGLITMDDILRAALSPKGIG